MQARGRGGGLFEEDTYLLFWRRGWALIQGRALIRAWALIRGNTVYTNHAATVSFNKTFSSNLI